MPPARNSSGGPRVPRGKRVVPSIPEVYKGVQFRSRLEVLFAQALEQRQIKWTYEPERIGGGRYLIDFYLPDLKCWVEVKGRFEARDDLLLPNAAGHLKAERHERLFLYMKTKAYRVTWKGFEPLSLEDFWQAIQQPPDAGDELRRPAPPPEKE
jgi:hypothetical protein